MGFLIVESSGEVSLAKFGMAGWKMSGAASAVGRVAGRALGEGREGEEKASFTLNAPAITL